MVIAQNEMLSAADKIRAPMAAYALLKGYLTSVIEHLTGPVYIAFRHTVPSPETSTTALSRTVTHIDHIG